MNELHISKFAPIFLNRGNWVQTLLSELKNGHFHIFFLPGF